MKRIIALLLALCLCLSLASAALAESAATDEADLEAIVQNEFKANRPESVFSRHASACIRYSFTDFPEYDYCIWETEDFCYYESASDARVLFKDGRVYALSKDPDEGDMEVGFCFEIDEDFDPIVSFVNGTEEEYNNALDMERTDLYLEDGLVHEIFRFNEARSREIIETYTALEYAGQTVLADMILDPETCELVREVDTIEQDGQTSVFYLEEYEYDTPEPMASRILRTVIERSSKNMITVDLVVDLETEQERSFSLSVPSNTEYLGVLTADKTPVFFCDPEFSTYYAWDCMSDLVAYVLTEPDDTLRLRYYMLCEEARKERGTALDPESVTVEALAAANAPEAVLSRHENADSVASVFGENSFTAYYEKGLFYQCTVNNDSDVLFGERGGWYYSDDDGDGEVELCFAWLAMNEEEAIERGDVRAEQLCAFVSQDVTPRETLLSVEQNTDDVFTVTTEMTPEDSLNELERMWPDRPEEYLEGTVRCAYVVAADTLELLALREYVRLNDELVLFFVACACYDTERPEGVDFYLAQEEALLSESAEERTLITVIYDAGTEQEESYSILVSDPELVTPVFRSGYSVDPAAPEGVYLEDGSWVIYAVK